MKTISRLLAPLALVAGLCLLMPADVQAGRGGGGGGGRGGGGGGRGGYGGGGRGGYGGGYGRGGYGGYGGYGGRGFGYGGYGYGYGGYGGFGWGGIGLGYGGGYYGGYDYPSYGYASTPGGYYFEPSSYSYSIPLVYTTPPNYDGGATVVPVGPGSDTRTTTSAYYNPGQPSATVEVRVPGDAKVWFDGTATTMSGDDRIFQTPALDAGKTYHYDVKAQWMKDGKPVEKTLTITVAAVDRKSVV